jgi:RHS repeat-associated protein
MLARLLFIWMFLLSSAAFASGEVMYIHTDGLGSPVARSDKFGNYISGSRTRYEPYGATAAGATPTIGFTGHVNDPDTGLIYMQQRYYDPYAGRFLSTDPVLTDANTGGSFNRYVYANLNPYKYLDPDGRTYVVVGSDSFIKATNAAISAIEKGVKGGGYIKELRDSKQNTVISQSETGKNSTDSANRLSTKLGIKADSEIKFNPAKTDGPVDEKGGTARPAYVGLAHEIGHALQIGKGDQSYDYGQKKEGTTPPAEKQALKVENDVRGENNIPLRPEYYDKNNSDKAAGSK